MGDFLLSAVNTILEFVGTLFNVFFFWLPVDPLSDYLNNVDVQAVAGNALSWLNWFVDVETFGVVLSSFVTVLVLFAAFKILMVIIDVITELVQSVKPF